MEITTFLHWLAVTLPIVHPGIEDAINVASGLVHFARERWTYAKPHSGYTQAARTLEGIQVLTGRPDMGIHISFPGEAITALRGAALQTPDLIGSLVQASGNFSRLDASVDAIDSALDIYALERQFDRHQTDTRARYARLLRSTGGGLTLYLGSPTSDRQLRIYNKAAERRNVGDIPDVDDWIRIELQLRNEPAHTAAHMVYADGSEARVIRTLILAFADWPHNHTWTRIMRGPIMGTGRSTRHVGNRRKWLLGAVAHSLAQEIALDKSFKTEFERSVAAALASLDKSGS